MRGMLTMAYCALGAANAALSYRAVARRANMSKTQLSGNDVLQQCRREAIQRLGLPPPPTISSLVWIGWNMDIITMIDAVARTTEEVP